MKKIFTSIGIVALGAAAVHGESASSMGMGGDNTKFWSVGASLRGFYDDNYNTGSQKPVTVITPSNPPSTNTAPSTARDSLGVEINPSISFKFPMDQTTIGLRYIYGASWYEDRQNLDSGNNAWDQSHEFDLLFSHAFSSRYTLDVTDSFVIAQEPELLNSVGAVTFPYRTQGNNIRNHGEITLNGGITKRLSFVLGYQNSFYDYENSSGNDNFLEGTGAVEPSLSGYLDRLEHEGLFNLRFQALPKTVLVAGYNFKQVNYLSDEMVANASNNPGTNNVSGFNDFRKADTRDSRAHIFYVGADQTFTKDLILSFRGGVQITEYYNAPATEPNDGNTSPWGRISLTYNYLPGSSVQVGFNHSRNQTDVVTPNLGNGSLTSDVETSLIYGSINHKFTQRISGKLTAQWQDSEFFGGLYDGQTEQFFDVGVNFSYRFNQYFSGEVGYNYSQLTSDALGRDYDRNRIYLGVSAAY